MVAAGARGCLDGVGGLVVVAGEADLCIGRDAEIELVESAIDRVLNGFVSTREAIHFSGDADIGKTELSRALARRLSSSSSSILIALPLDGSPFADDPIDRLLGIRADASRQFPFFDPAPFDYALNAYCLKYQQTRLAFLNLPKSDFSPGDLLEESFTDSLKKGGEEALKEIAALVGPSIASATSGAMASAVLNAMGAGMIAAGTFVSVLVLRHMLAGLARRRRDRNLLDRDPALALFLSSDRFDRPLLEAELPRVLGRCLGSSGDAGSPMLPCLLLDPADRLADVDHRSPLGQVGRVVASAFSEVPRMVVVATSRASCRDWQALAESGKTVPAVPFEARRLGPLDTNELERWVTDHGYKGAWPPEGVMIEGGASPRRFSEWWRSGAHEADPRTRWAGA